MLSPLEPCSTVPWTLPQEMRNQMPYRVYLRWPGQRASDKTITESAAVAQFALQELLDRAPETLRGSIGIAMTQDNRQLLYRCISPNGQVEPVAGVSHG